MKQGMRLFGANSMRVCTASGMLSKGVLLPEGILHGEVIDQDDLQTQLWLGSRHNPEQDAH